MTKERYLHELARNGGQQTVDHVKGVGRLMKEFAKPLKLNSKTLEVAGVLHDAGKIFVPYNILNSATALSKDDRKIILTHPKAATGVIGNIIELTPEERKIALECAWYHHAWINGEFFNPDTRRGGYYKGMEYEKEYSFKDTLIPLPARLCAIADGFEAMTSTRSYQKARTAKDAEKIIAQQAKKGQYDYYLCTVFVGSVLGYSVSEFADMYREAVA